MTKTITGIIPMLIVICILTSCFSSGNGSNTFIKKESNNKHSKTAILFLKESGATVADSYQVSIADYNSQPKPDAIGNTFIADDNHGKAHLSPKAINLNWVSNDTLAITYDKNLRTFLQTKAVGGITVIYKTY